MSTESSPKGSTGRASVSRSSVLVASGILLSRIAGLIRSRFIAHVLGQSNDFADAFTAALRIPNFLQNLFGEAALSASFIPVYAGLRESDRAKEADDVARTVLALLFVMVSVIVLIGVTGAPLFVDLVSKGYTGAKRELLIELVRIMFPGIGLLVFSAWCLAILNSHGRFFLSYTAPVLWNAAMVTVLIVFRHADPASLTRDLAWGAVAGSALQLGVQLPTVARVMARHWTGLTFKISEHVRKVIGNFGPVLFSRGAVQISAIVDGQISSYLGMGAQAALGNAQMLGTLPISLFGMAVSAAELPAMSGAAVGPEAAATLRARLDNSQRTIAVFVISSAVAFLVLGDVVGATLFQTGKFTHADAVVLWAILAGSAVGLLSSTLGRLYSTAFYALGDTRTPVAYALIRVALVAILGYLFAFPLRHALGLAQIWGTAGLTASAGLAGWIEFALLRRSLQRRVGTLALPASALLRAWTAAMLAGAVASGFRWVVPATAPLTRGVLILGTYGAIYFALAIAFKLVTASDVVKRFKR